MEDRPIEPLTGGALAFLGSFGDVAYETYKLPAQIVMAVVEGCSSSKDKSAAQTSPKDKPKHRDGRISGRALSAELHPLPKGVEVALATATSIGRLSKAVLESPLHFSMGIARGFQNIPIAYGDTSVRKPENVSGLKSGIEVGSKVPYLCPPFLPSLIIYLPNVQNGDERVPISLSNTKQELAYGFYDGITGVITQPLRGAKQDGVVGLVKGIGFGLGGLVLKPGKGLFGLPAYALKGVEREVSGLFGGRWKGEGCIVAGRWEQGRAEMVSCGEEERIGILRAWEGVRREEMGN